MPEINYRDGRSEVTLLERCRELRLASTDAERRLWSVLRGSQLGAKFRRQHQFGLYILDFHCAEKGLAIEADGAQHYESVGIERDLSRTSYLEMRGLRLLRFSDREILQETAAVLEAIRAALGEPSPQPSPRGRGSDRSRLLARVIDTERGQ